MIRLCVLNDTIMNKLSQNQNLILNIFLKNTTLSSSDVHEMIVKNGIEISLITIKRDLSELKDLELLNVSGAGRSVIYSISSKGRLISNINSHEYCSIEPDKRFGLNSYNFQLFNSINDELFSIDDINELNKSTEIYRKNTESISTILEEKELERFIIELSWKSSRIEGNTYTLLDTERLIVKGIEAEGHNKDEAKMILNHKAAFKFIKDNISEFKEFKLSTIEEVHKILISDLNVNFGLRNKAVGVTGSIYRPLDNIHQIKDAIDALCELINRINSPYLKAMLIILGISYIQPFEDGNKRTSRLMANSILLFNKLAPLSYRSVDENEYREAILVFYELNSILPFKKIFMEQYIFAAKNYAVN